MKILLIGGTGTIGRSVAEAVLDAGHHLTLYTRGSREVPQQWRSGGRLSVVYGDRRDYAAFEDAISGLPVFDCVIDMLIFEPEDVESLVRAFGRRTGQVIMVSTVDTYHKPASRYPVREDEPAGWNSDYGRNKVLCEELLSTAAGRGVFAVTCMKCGHTYDDEGWTLNTMDGSTLFLDRMRAGKPVVIHDNGQGLWSSVHATDVAAAFVAAAGNTAAFGQSYILAGSPITWEQYNRLYSRVVGNENPEFVFIPSEFIHQITGNAKILMDNLQFPSVYDTSKAETELGFRLTVPLAEGARRQVEWRLANGGFVSWTSAPAYDELIKSWRVFRMGAPRLFREDQR